MSEQPSMQQTPPQTPQQTPPAPDQQAPATAKPLLYLPRTAHSRLLLLHTAERAQEVWSSRIYDWVLVWDVFMCAVWVSVLLLRPNFLSSSPYLEPLQRAIGYKGALWAFLSVGVWQLLNLVIGSAKAAPKKSKRAGFWSPPTLLRHAGFVATSALFLVVLSIQAPAGWTPGFGTTAGMVFLQYLAIGQMYSHIGIDMLKDAMRAEDAAVAVAAKKTSAAAAMAAEALPHGDSDQF